MKLCKMTWGIQKSPAQVCTTYRFEVIAPQSFDIFENFEILPVLRGARNL